MNKLNMLLAGVAAFGLVACSSDELENGGVVDPTAPTGDVAYMNINIKDANAMSRTTTSGEGEAGLEFGDEDTESNVKTAHFYFFNENGSYANIKASVWSDGGMNPTKPNNIEHFGKNVIVLTGLTTTTYPKYMITVINQPDGFDTKIEDAGTIEAASKIIAQCQNADASFVMSSTSYYNEGQTIKNHADTYYYANELEAKNFIRTNSENPVTPGQLNPDDNAVDVYVERLAAKVQLSVGMTPVEGKENLYKLDITVGGEGINDDDSNNDTADSNIYISFEGWGLNAVANESYLSKQIQNWTDLTFTWNVPSFRRSYWGMGVAYGKAIDTTTITNTNKTNGYLTYYSWADLNNTVGGVQYCNEYTNTPANVVKTKKVMDNGVEKDETTVDPSATTSVLLKTRICDENGNQLDMVLHNGVLYTKNGYLSLVINALKAAKTGKYYYENGTEPDGSTKYTKIEAAKLIPMVKLEAIKGEGDAKIHVVVATDADFSTLPKLYTIDTDNNVTEMTNVAGDLANDLVEAQNNWVAQEYKEGMMYYNIPVEHLAASEGAKVDAEGYYGVVRNHWYKLTVNSVKRLGHPVLDVNEVIVPKVEDPTYYLGAQINILSWKVVNQNVTLE